MVQRLYHENLRAEFAQPFATLPLRPLFTSGSTPSILHARTILFIVLLKRIPAQVGAINGNFDDFRFRLFDFNARRQKREYNIPIKRKPHIAA